MVIVAKYLLTSTLGVYNKRLEKTPFILIDDIWQLNEAN